MITNLSVGAKCGGSLIKTKKDIPMIFRVSGNYLQYSVDNGINWISL